MQKLNKKYRLIGGNTDIKDALMSNYKLIIIFIIFTLGIVYSLLTYVKVNAGDSTICQLLQQQYTIKATQTFKEYFLNSISSYAIYFTIVALFGLCAIGLPVLILIPFTYGVNVGYQVTYLYMEYQSKGIGYTALIVAPIALIFGSILLISVCEGINMSWDILSSIQDGKRPNMTLATYFKRFIVFALAIVASTALFSLINTGISKLIQL